MVQIEASLGLRLNLTSYHKIRSYAGGAGFWEQANQQLLTQCLGEFLPRAVEHPENNTVLYSCLEHGMEILSSSTPLNSVARRTADVLLTKLRLAVKAMKAREADPKIDPNAKRLIQAFRLPDPHKDPELYRVTNGSSRRLLVLWGVEKEVNSALPPESAVAQLPEATRTYGKWLAAALALGIAGWLWSATGSKSSTEELRSEEHATVPVKPEGATQPTVIAVTQPAIGGAGESPIQPQPGQLPRTGDQQPPSEGTQVTHGGLGVLPPEDKSHPEVTPSPPEQGMAASHRGSATERSTQQETESSSQESTDTAEGKTSTSVAPSPKEGGQTKDQAQPESAAKTQQSTSHSGERTTPQGTGPAPARTDAKTEAPSSPNGSAPDKADAKAPNSPGDSPPGAAQNASANSDLTLEIINTTTSSSMVDGKVEIVLSVIGRNPKKTLVGIRQVRQWTIDGKRQMQTTGQPISTPTLPILLSVGTHQVAVDCFDDNGAPITTSVLVEVGTRKVDTPEVTIKPNLPTK